MSEWIDIKDKLPELNGEFFGSLVSDDVIAFSETKGEVNADFSSEGWCDEDGDMLSDVKKWRPHIEPS